LNEDIKHLSRDSFSDRICDELSEYILNYLTLEDKFKIQRSLSTVPPMSGKTFVETNGSKIELLFGLRFE